MHLVCIGHLRKSGIFLALALIFSGIQPDFKSNSISSLISIAPAFGTYGGVERNNGDRKFLEYDERTILALTPRKAKKIFRYYITTPKIVFKIKGYSSSLSTFILLSLSTDTEYTKCSCSGYLRLTVV